MHCADVVLKLVSVSVPLIGCSVVCLLHCDERSMEAHFCQKKKHGKKEIQYMVIFSITCNYSLKKSSPNVLDKKPGFSSKYYGMQ